MSINVIESKDTLRPQLIIADAFLIFSKGHHVEHVGFERIHYVSHTGSMMPRGSRIAHG